MTNNNCEDFETGLYLPCDDAGIPGLGGSSSPCLLYNAPNARARAWPESFIDVLEDFLRRSTSINLQR